jgi:Kef-type K+ transport system membrane component KefB
LYPDATPLLVGIAILLASLISLRVGLSVAIIELILGVLFGNLGVIHVESWMTLVAGFGGILLTFLAGTEIDTDLMREKFTQTFLIGFFSFLMPFIAVFLFAYFGAQWGLEASLIAGTALSTTSLAVVYSVLIETNLSRTDVGKLLMASCFVTDMATVIALTVLFITPTVYTGVFIAVSVVVIVLATKFSHIVFDHPQLKDKVVEPEIKYLLVLLLVFMYFASLGNGQAVLPAFLLGLFMSKHFVESSETKRVRNRLRTVAYAIITPVFFIVGGSNVSVPLILTALGLFVVFLAIKLSAKFVGVYFLAKKYIPHGSAYTTLLMSTGLTFGTIASVFGLTAGYINQVQYSVLVGVVVATAVLPTFIAQKWFMPVHSEDVLDINGGNGESETAAV